MNQRLAIALLTIVLLGAGFGAGVWTTRSQCKVPPPPPTLLGELSAKSTPPEAAHVPKASAPNLGWIVPTIERLRPQIEEFRVRLDAIDKEMDRKIDAILRPDQRELFLELVKKGEIGRARERAESELTTKLTPEEIQEIQQRPLQRLLSIVVVPIRVYWNTKQLKLDDAQKAQLTEILKWRREKFLALIDESPPPSLELSTLVPVAQRLPEKTEKPDAKKPEPKK